jgi:hypothetical protein
MESGTNCAVHICSLKSSGPPDLSGSGGFFAGVREALLAPSGSSGSAGCGAEHLPADGMRKRKSSAPHGAELPSPTRRQQSVPHSRVREALLAPGGSSGSAGCGAELLRAGGMRKRKSSAPHGAELPSATRRQQSVPHSASVLRALVLRDDFQLELLCGRVSRRNDEDQLPQVRIMFPNRGIKHRVWLFFRI